MLSFFRRYSYRAKPIHCFAAFLLLWSSSSAHAQQAKTETSTPESDWQIICESTGQPTQSKQSCRMAQSLLDREERRPLLVARVFAGKQPSLLLQTPLQVFLKAGVMVQVDKGKRYAFAYEFCNLEGCYAGVPLPNSLLTSFRRGKTAVFKLTDTQGKQASFDISLKGFTKTYDELSGKN